MDQPNYTYKKGQGWVVGPDCARESRVNDRGMKLTLERRRPEPEERYYTMESHETLDDVFKDVLKFIRLSDRIGEFGDHYTEENDLKRDDEFAVIVGVEQVDGPE